MNDNIRHKLFHYSETPPPVAWDRLATALDENLVLTQKLYDFKTPPPAATWQKIEQHLESSNTPVVSLRNRLFKTAIAAAVVLAIAAGTIYFLKNTSTENAARTTAVMPPENAFLKPESRAQPTTDSPAANNGDAEMNAASDNKSSMALVRFAARVHIAKRWPTPVNVTPEEKTMINTDLPDRYMIATTRTGKVVRLPKKAYGDYACAEASQNYLCREKLAAIQSKLATSVATDFTDFIDLLKKLQDTQ